jgi:hypothetical protein
MYKKAKIGGSAIFVVLLTLGLLYKNIRGDVFYLISMIVSLILTAYGFYFEEKTKNSILLYNGKIYSLDNENTVYSALFIDKGIIKDLGNNNLIEKYGKNAREIIDLKGKTVLPGFNDSHMHMYGYGESLKTLDLREVKSVDELVELGIKALEGKNFGKNEWFRGRGWNQEIFDNREFPTYKDLDRISKDIPIVFTRVCCHIAVVNSKALELINVDENTEVEGGEIEKNSKGKLTGVFKENALSLINTAQGKPSMEEIEDTLLKSQEKLLSYGITSVQTDDLQHTGHTWDIAIKAYILLNKKKKLKLRINQQCLFFKTEDFKEFIKLGAHGINEDMRFKTGPLKLLGDGSLGARTALLYEPYFDDNTKIGITAYAQEQLNDFIDIAYENDIPVAIHAIGDRMMDMALDSIEMIRKKHNKKLRDGIVHCQITTDKIFDRFERMGIMAYIQPIFTVGDWKVVNNRIGNERSKTTYNWKRFYDIGVNVSLGTDSPVESPNPFENIYAAVTRKDFEGKPENGWMPEQKLSINEALEGYTINSAFASGEEKIKGSIEKGKLGDVIVVSDDIFMISEDEIKNVYTEMTIVSGEIVFKNK